MISNRKIDEGIISDYHTSIIASSKKTKLTDIYKDNWLKYMEDWLFINTKPWPNDLPPDGAIIDKKNMPLWTKQVEIVEALRIHKKVAVKSCKGAGKTYIAAVLALTMLNVLKALGITTAPTFRQVRRMLWGEIHKVYHKAENKLNKTGRTFGGQLNQLSLEYDPKWYMEGFSTDEPYNISGYHAENMFLILDEAGLLKPELYDVAEGILTSRNSYVLAIGNPIDPTNPFKNLFTPDSGFYQITMSCDDIPNVKHNRIIYPELTSPEWPIKMLKKWGPAHPLYIGNVLGEFPEESKSALVPWKYLQASMEKAKELIENKSQTISIGCDVARYGDDFTVFQKLREDGVICVIERTAKEGIDETVGRAKSYHMDLNPKCINIDDIGLGGGVTDFLKADYPANGICVSEVVDKKEEDADKFVNKRAFYYWKLRTGIINGKYFIHDEDTADEIHRLKVVYAGGRIKIISKDDYKKLYNGKSPDNADAAMLAISETEFKKFNWEDFLGE